MQLASKQNILGCKHIFLFFLIPLCSLQNITSQEKMIGIQYEERGEPEVLDLKKVFYKDSRMPIPEKEFKNLVRNNPHLYLERIYDADGILVSYLYDPKYPQGNFSTTSTCDVSMGADFPNFRMTTLDNKKIELASFKGKLVLLRFERHANDFRFKKHEIEELDNKMNALKNKDDIKAIIIFSVSEEEIRKGFDLVNSNFQLIPNANNFIQKYGIRRFPLTLLIDQKGKLIEIFKYSEDIDFSKYLNN